MNNGLDIGSPIVGSDWYKRILGVTSDTANKSINRVQFNFDKLDGKFTLMAYRWYNYRLVTQHIVYSIHPTSKQLRKDKKNLKLLIQAIDIITDPFNTPVFFEPSLELIKVYVRAKEICKTANFKCLLTDYPISSKDSIKEVDMEMLFNNGVSGK